MMQRKILHICIADKFIEPFIRFIADNFDDLNHQFVILAGDYTKVQMTNRANVSHSRSFFGVIKLIGWMQGANKIIIHGLSFELVKLLVFQPWLLKKCYWVIWGGDLYCYQSRPTGFKSDVKEIMRKFVIKRIGHFVTYIKGDFELARKWYGAKGDYHNCFMYQSNLYKDYAIPPKLGQSTNILVGNSADPTNNHTEVFEKLRSHKNQNIQIYCPLSYGPVEYANQIARLGKEMFGDKFIPLLDFMAFEKYLELLGNIDIAVFAHKRQQGMGNTISLLGLGKKVYMRSDVTPWMVFNELGVKVFSVEKFTLKPIDEIARCKNRETIRNVFSERKLIEQYKNIFE